MKRKDESKRARGMHKSKTQKQTQTTERVTGDALFYFITHNIISVAFFFFFTIGLEVYEIADMPIISLFSIDFMVDFWNMVIFDVFLFSVFSSIIGRILAFGIMKLYFYLRNKKRRRQKTMKIWSELNSGINRFNLMVFLITAFLTSIIYSLGVIATLNNNIFDESSLITLIVVYAMFKISIYFVVRWITKAKT